MGSLYLTVTSISVFSRQALAINNKPFIYFMYLFSHSQNLVQCEQKLLIKL